MLHLKIMNKLLGWDDTIVAPATAPGIAAIAVIRLSGADAIAIADRLFPAKDLGAVDSHTLHVGFLKEEGQMLDEVVISVFRAPRSYTGEHVVEISCHGSPFVQQQIVDACIRQGARLARPGEFTQRAFLNGKLDLTQAEAVADLIASNTEAAMRTALHSIRGGFSVQLRELRERLMRFSALLELELDFSQEDVQFADRAQFYNLVSELEDITAKLVDSFRLGNVIRNGVSVAIVGRPNAGKSTLLNALLNEDRAIVSEVPGTTRDTIEEVINMDGILFRLIDTAGIREHTSDLIEAAGMERSREKMQQAGLVLFLFDLDDSREEVRKWREEMDAQGLNYVLVGNKLDRHDAVAMRQKFAGLDVVFISAHAREGISELKHAMVDRVLAGTTRTEDIVVTNARHYQALQEVQASLRDIRAGLDRKLPGDLLALDVRRCLHYLGEITGEVSNEEMLGYIFSRFCIGK